MLAWRGGGNGDAQSETVTLTLPLRERPRRASLEGTSTAGTERRLGCRVHAPYLLAESGHRLPVFVISFRKGGGLMDEPFCFDPYGGMDREARDDGADENPGGIGGCLDDETLVRIVARILPLGHDPDAVAGLEGFGTV